MNEEVEKCLNDKSRKNSYDINIYNIKKEDVIIQDNMNINKKSTIDIDNNDQVNIYIENSDLNKKIYNCYTCNIQIYNFSFFRYHFKSEWHKYNLKRKLLNLNSINELTFNEKLKNLKINQENKEEKENNNHKKNSNNNKKKKEKKSNSEFYNHKKLNNTSDFNKIKYATKEDILLKKNVKYDNPLVCFFDNRIFNSIEENIKHMNDDHTFFIPDEKYVTDIKKIILTIGKKIYEENMCIYCFKYSKCVKSIQEHMICKGHTKIHDDFFVFIEKYYDFSKTYVDLLNKYIHNKEDKEEILYLLQKKKKKEITSRYHMKEEQTNKENNETDSLKCKNNEDSKSNNDLIKNEVKINNDNHKLENPVFEKRFNTQDNLDNDENGNDMDINHVDNNINLSFDKHIDDSNTNKYRKDICEMNNNNDTCDDFKVKEEDLSKNLNYDIIYEVLEQFGYNKPEINEYNNLVLPDGSEAINRKIAYIFKQKLPLENRTKCDKIDVLKKKENSLQYRKYKYYIDYIKKYNLNLNLKTNNLNKFYKSDSIFFI
ncbi:zinc finger protein, putative [Plasmodium gallinaceum]|uniref:Zinc finger protein, putative n=1 Tax=Plasmodium gallinaceum TaxID=5849 RepID=A0A1J1H096_PLAGA|nr:zinc finger protein, putative [Plasmodium gallinaceum]CRG98169.1 zinc finger protein, putative [Plasmodium gallinaceum]